MRTLREEWQVLRGLPERESPTIGDEPCVEVSDARRLCRNPLVSVICLVWNHEKWLDECISGMVNQNTDFDFEILLCEDHSTDMSREVCLKWLARCPEKIRVISGRRNLGVWRNLGLGYRESHGSYVAFLEGDDYWSNAQKLQKQMDLMRIGGYRFVVAWNDVLHESTGTLETLRFPNRTEVSLADYRGGYYHTSTYLMTKALYDQIDAYCHLMLRYDTTEFLLTLGLGEKIGVLTEKVSVYRRTGTGIYTGNTGARNAEIGIRMFTALLRHGPGPLRNYCRYSYECALLDYFIHTTRDQGFAWRNLLALGLAVINLTFRINSRHTCFLWGSALKSLFVRTRKKGGQ